LEEDHVARRVFFSFYYEKDIWRASQIRNSWVTKADREAAGFWDAASWEEVKKKGDAAIQRWIDNELVGTSVTVVLIGTETSNREWVRYEIQQSHKRGNGLFGVYIHNMKDQYGNTATAGNNNFGVIGKDASGNDRYFWELYPSYDWVLNDGYSNLGSWIEAAAKKAGR
jgi:hypothetical protein